MDASDTPNHDDCTPNPDYDNERCVEHGVSVTPRDETDEMRPTLAFCERVTATPTSAEHIREVGPEGLKMGGGIPNVALCGYDVVRGWDLATEVTPETVRALATPRAGDGHVFLCARCAGAYFAATEVSS